MFMVFNSSYLFSVLWLVCLILINFIYYFNMFSYLKFLVILVYTSGVVVFILYISCLCWNSTFSFNKLFLFFVFFIFMIFDFGSMTNFMELGSSFFMFFFFSLLFSILVTYYSLYLFKGSGSLRF